MFNLLPFNPKKKGLERIWSHGVFFFFTAVKLIFFLLTLGTNPLQTIPTKANYMRENLNPIKDLSN